jgi:hypothetical protein
MGSKLRSDQARSAQRLVARGATYRDVASALGISEPYAWYLVNDPDGERARMMYRRGSTPLAADAVACRECGRSYMNLGSHLRVHGMNKTSYLRKYPGSELIAPGLRDVGREALRERLGEEPRYWTRERIITSIRSYVRAHGAVPSATAWKRKPGRKAASSPGSMRRPSRSRPDVRTVATMFGSWSAALAAAGYEPRPAHGPIKQVCKRGHPLEGDNVYVAPSGRRACKVCMREGATRRYREKGQASGARGGTPTREARPETAHPLQTRAPAHRRQRVRPPRRGAASAGSASGWGRGLSSCGGQNSGHGCRARRERRLHPRRLVARSLCAVCTQMSPPPRAVLRYRHMG